MNDDFITEEELKTARRDSFMGEMNVLKMSWWKELTKLTGAYDSLSVLRSFIEAMFYTLNGEHEKVKEIPCLVGKDYEKRVRVMQRAMRMLGEAMEVERFVDFLGAADQALRGKGSQDCTGAFYTPTSLCEAMGGIAANADIKAKFERGEIVTVYDPTVGAGRTLLAFCKVNAKYLDQIRAFGTDIEINAVRMFYVNCALNGIAARCVHGNELSNEREWAVYYTPEWHVYEYDRNIKLQMDKWRSIFESMQETAAKYTLTMQQEPQKELEASESDNSAPQEENAQETPTEREKMDVIVEEGGQLVFNF